MEWKEILFDDFCRLNRGFDLPNDNIVEGDVPVVASSSIKAFHNVAKVKGPGVVTGRSGTLGIVQYIEQDFWPLNTSLYVKDFKGNSPKFCFYVLQMMHLENFNAGAGVPTLNQNHLHKLKIKVPATYDEQEKVASVLSNYDTLIDINTKRIKLLEESAHELYKEWFVRMRFPGYEQTKFVKGIPEGWKYMRIDEFAELSAGSDKPKDFSEFVTDDYKVPVFSNGITNDGLQGYTRTARITEPSVTVSARGTIGFVRLREEPYVPIVRLVVLMPQKNRLPLIFMYHLIDSIPIFGTGASQEQLTVPDFSKVKVLVPTKNLTNIFSEIVKPLYTELNLLKDTNNNLSATRDRLLPRLLSGGLKVKA